MKEWEDADAALFVGTHGPASDGYYQWYVDHDMGRDNGLYHICDCEVSKCKAKKGRADRRELIHTLGKVAPLDSTGHGGHWLSSRFGSQARASWPTWPGKRRLLEHKWAPGWRRPEQGGRTQEGRASRPKEKELRKRSCSPRRGKDSMPQFLLQQAAKQGEKKTVQVERRRKEDRRRSQRERTRIAPRRRPPKKASLRVFNLPRPGGASCRGLPKRNPGASAESPSTR